MTMTMFPCCGPAGLLHQKPQSFILEVSVCVKHELMQTKHYTNLIYLKTTKDCYSKNDDN